MIKCETKEANLNSIRIWERRLEMDSSVKFKDLREKYQEFVFKDYSIKENENEIILEYEFEITGCAKFKPTIKILKKNIKLKNIKENKIKNMVFHIGLVELISYWKCTCSPKVIIKCGFLNKEQVDWFKKLYFYGLGELFYTNGIKTSIDEFMEITCEGEEIKVESEKDMQEGYIVPIGGGKDSAVTLETLNLDRKKDFCSMVNPKNVMLECAKLAGFDNDHIIEMYRKIDPKLIELNKEGFINGHTPFSSLLAFLNYFVAYITGKKYIALSNENSANESNVVGEKINHQYSKSYEFENDFYMYSEKYLKGNVKYFSFLRPLSELQIAKIFSRLKKYHHVFKSCNVGSKDKNWNWCGKCPKCLFVYIVLSPYLYKDELVDIFKKDLYEDESLLKIFIELIGRGETKPFECVGTFEEVNYAISKLISKLESKKQKLPYLLKYYKDNFGLIDTSIDITKRLNKENNLTEEQFKELERAINCD